MTLTEVFTILTIHYIGDFCVQTDWQAKNKSKSNLALTKHICSYIGTFMVLFALVALFTGYPFPFKCIAHRPPDLACLLFFIITFICHWITDYFTSRLNSKLWAAGKSHLFFVSVGADQLLHYFQLFLTYKLLTQ